MCIGELSTETNRIETVVVRFEVATIFATEKSEEELNAGRMISSISGGLI